PDSSPDSDSPNVPTPAPHSYSYQITQAGLLAKQRSSFPPLSHRGKRVAHKAFRKESRRRRRCLFADQRDVLSAVQATCSQPCPSPHPDRCPRDELARLFVLDCHQAELTSQDRSREFLRVRHS